MRTYQQKLHDVREFIEDNIYDVDELCRILRISIEDIMHLFPDRLVEMHDEIFEYDFEEREELNEQDEERAWAGYDTEGYAKDVRYLSEEDSE